MVAESKPTSQLTIKTGMQANDRVLTISLSGPNTETASITIDNLLANSGVPIKANTFYLKEKSTPANSSISVPGNRVWFDDNYIYVSTANNVVKRAALSSF